jgi:prevent-host-death family protein
MWYNINMKTVPIGDLKKSLSALISEVEGGQQVLVTRHRRPVAILTGAAHLHLHRGARFGEGAVLPAVERGSRGRFLEVLAEDRRGAHGR